MRSSVNFAGADIVDAECNDAEVDERTQWPTTLAPVGAVRK